MASLQDLSFPVLLLHDQEIDAIEDVHRFNKLATPEVTNGYFDDVRFIDARGDECAIERIYLLRGSAWMRLFGIPGPIDFELRKLQTHSPIGMRDKILQHLRDHPEFWFANGSPWEESEVPAKLASASTHVDLIRAATSCAVLSYRPCQDVWSPKLVDKRNER